MLTSHYSSSCYIDKTMWLKNFNKNLNKIIFYVYIFYYIVHVEKIKKNKQSNNCVLICYMNDDLFVETRSACSHSHISLHLNSSRCVSACDHLACKQQATFSHVLLIGMFLLKLIKTFSYLYVHLQYVDTHSHVRLKRDLVHITVTAFLNEDHRKIMNS